MVTFVKNKDLGFLLETPKSRRMDDPVTVAGKTAPRRAFGFRYEPAPAGAGFAGEGGKRHSCPPLTFGPKPPHLEA